MHTPLMNSYSFSYLLIPQREELFLLKLLISYPFIQREGILAVEYFINSIGGSLFKT
jgi:hypothetical protein